MSSRFFSRVINISDIYYDLTSSKQYELEEPNLFDYSTNNKNPGLQNLDLIIVNNSFIYREFLTTNKSKKYLGFLGEKPNEYNLVISTGVEINKDYTKISRKSSSFPLITSLNKAINEEIASLGSIVIILIGNIQYSDPISEKINLPEIDEVQLNFHLEKNYMLKESILEINPHSHTIDIIDPLSKEIGLSVEDQTKIKKIIDNLRKNTILPLSIPNKNTDLEKTFLDNIIQPLKGEIQNYEKSLAEWIKDEGDDVNFTNILRISYTFVDDAISLIELVFSICDLKPVLSWLTLNSQYKLYKTFSKLDWQKEGKPSLSLYIKLIKEARNSRFHKLFNIKNTIEVNLEGINLQAKYLRMFSEYKNRSSILSNFSYEEKQLIELLLNFTRTDERKITTRFWKQNLEIMNSTLSLIVDFSESLKMLRTL